tara:strand:+ start:386 stop:535 length:150 start_codon:yes stop_codon:yes gene_type:complete
MYCDICEDVIDREDTHTRIEGLDYCLDCYDQHLKNIAKNGTAQDEGPAR